MIWGDESNQSEAEEVVDEPLYENAPITLGQCLLLIMSVVIGNNLTSVAIGNLLKLLSMILPIGSRLPRTKYPLDKYFNGFRQGLEYKFFCPSCKTLIKTSDSLKCTICDEEYERQQLLEKGNFFLYLPIEKQLKDFCQNRGVSKDLDYRFNRVKDDDVISNIYDGQMYKSLGNGLLESCISKSINKDLLLTDVPAMVSVMVKSVIYNTVSHLQVEFLLNAAMHHICHLMIHSKKIFVH